MTPQQIKKLKQPDGQDRNVFNGFKRTLKEMSEYTDEQIAMIHYESWDEAHKRAGRPEIE